jgi:thiol:disulfide interchange protein DsbC
MFFRWLIVVCCSFIGLIGYASAETPADQKKIESAIAALLPGAVPDAIAPAPVPGLYEVIVGTQLYYMTQDGRYLIQGEIYHVPTVTNVTEPRRNMLRAKAIENIGEENMVIFAPEKVGYTVTVFTDIDCGYCRKLHNEMDNYQAKGIKIRYVFFPRSGPNTPSFEKAVSVWCADDRNKALTEAKTGTDPLKKQCDNPVLDHYNTGQLIGVSGTPSIILEDGQVVPGYMPADSLAARLGIN